MRGIRISFVIVGLMVVVSCSEKQKEAARLEAQMRQQGSGDSVGLPVDSQIAAAVQDSSVNQESAQVSTQLSASTEMTTDTTTSPGSGVQAATIEQQVTTSPSSVAETTTKQFDSGRPEITSKIEPAPDAGAIPDEDAIKKTPARQRQVLADKPTVPNTSSATATDTIATGKGFVLQISSTPDEREANSLAARFIKYGYQAFVTDAFIDGTTYFRVRIGKYPSVSAANDALGVIHEKYGVSGYVAELR